MSDYQNFLMGKDWIITITIPNKLLSKYPDQVRVLQFTIQMELERFNAEIKKLDGGMQKVRLGDPQGEDKIYTESEKQALLARMEKERAEREGGGGLSGTH